MSEQDSVQSSTNPRMGRKTSTKNQQNGKQASAAQRPSNDDIEAWKVYWKAQGQTWRSEPDIDEERQKYLAQHRSIIPDIKQGIYPFKDIKLTRADVEWLLATHENGRGPVYWNDESQRERDGLDLRGADLRQTNLSGLPLTRMRGGLTFKEWFQVTEEQRGMAAVHLEGADLGGAQLQIAHLGGAQLQGADLWRAQLQEVSFLGAQLQGANLRRADLEHATLDQITFSDQTYGSAHFADINWGNVNLAVVDWGHVTKLGDEQKAYQEKDSEGKTKDKQTRLNEYKESVRANRQLVVVLLGQGLNEDATRFAYVAQVLQRQMLQRQMLLQLEQMSEELRGQMREYKSLSIINLLHLQMISLYHLCLPSLSLLRLEQILEEFFPKFSLYFYLNFYL